MVVEKWTEKVTVRPFVAGRLIDPHEGQDAYRASVAGDGFVLKTIYLYNPGSEIVQADGTTWVVIKSHLGDAETRIAVTKKAPGSTSS